MEISEESSTARKDGKINETNLMRRSNFPSKSVVLSSDDFDEVSGEARKRDGSALLELELGTRRVDESQFSPFSQPLPLPHHRRKSKRDQTHWNMYWLSSVWALTPWRGSKIPSFFLTSTIFLVIVEAP